MEKTPPTAWHGRFIIYLLRYKLSEQVHHVIFFIRAPCDFFNKLFLKEPLQSLYWVSLQNIYLKIQTIM